MGTCKGPEAGTSWAHQQNKGSLASFVDGRIERRDRSCSSGEELVGRMRSLDFILSSIRAFQAGNDD